MSRHPRLDEGTGFVPPPKTLNDVLVDLRWRKAYEEEYQSTATPALFPVYGRAIAHIDATIRILESLHRSSRENFDALCAMRNDINEYIPLPSLDSDLLSGPETSVFCSVVAEAVINAVKEKNHE